MQFDPDNLQRESDGALPLSVLVEAVAVPGVEGPVAPDPHAGGEASLLFNSRYFADQLGTGRGVSFVPEGKDAAFTPVDDEHEGSVRNLGRVVAQRHLPQEGRMEVLVEIPVRERVLTGLGTLRRMRDGSLNDVSPQVIRPQRAPQYLEDGRVVPGFAYVRVQKLAITREGEFPGSVIRKETARPVYDESERARLLRDYGREWQLAPTIAMSAEGAEQQKQAPPVEKKEEAPPMQTEKPAESAPAGAREMTKDEMAALLKRAQEGDGAAGVQLADIYRARMEAAARKAKENEADAATYRKQQAAVVEKRDKESTSALQALLTEEEIKHIMEVGNMTREQVIDAALEETKALRRTMIGNKILVGAQASHARLRDENKALREQIAAAQAAEAASGQRQAAERLGRHIESESAAPPADTRSRYDGWAKVEDKPAPTRRAASPPVQHSTPLESARRARSMAERLRDRRQRRANALL